MSNTNSNNSNTNSDFIGGGGSAGSKQQEEKFDCDKCAQSFPRIDLLKEHQLIHILNPPFDALNPFAFLQNLQQQQQAATTKPQEKEGVDLTKKQQQQVQLNEMENSEIKTQQYDFLLNYFMQNEQNAEIKKHGNLSMEFLFNFYQTNEIKKNNLLKNYDFLHQYYMENREDDDDEDDETQEKTLDFLLQFYQLNESKKMFNQSGASVDADAAQGPQSQGGVQPPPQGVVTSAEKQTKRLRTTILPEQLNFLYECYQNESNPSRKMLEEISKKVNLKKRVVQVITVCDFSVFLL